MQLLGTLQGPWAAYTVSYVRNSSLRMLLSGANCVDCWFIFLVSELKRVSGTYFKVSVLILFWFTFRTFRFYEYLDLTNDFFFLKPWG